MSDQPFTSQNDLERQLMAAQDGELSPESFIETLLGAEVFMPIYERHAVGGSRPRRRPARSSW